MNTSKKALAFTVPNHHCFTVRDLYGLAHHRDLHLLYRNPMGQNHYA